MNRTSTSLVGILIAVVLSLSLGAVGSVGMKTIGSMPSLMVFALLSFTIQWCLFLPAYFWQTEKYYDLTGSLTYILLALLALAAREQLTVYDTLIAGMVILWASRLGLFLFFRIRVDGSDRRFEKIKPDFFRFLMTWTLQGLWVFVTFSAGLAAILAPGGKDIGIVAIVGVCLWLTGFSIEIIADRQKRRFRAQPANEGRFICQGLWKYSRHPNYFGEILLWTGLAIMAFSVLTGWQYLTLISPVFVCLLLTKISGINLLEASGNKRWGDSEDYQAYLDSTPVLVPRLFKR